MIPIATKTHGNRRLALLVTDWRRELRNLAKSLLRLVETKDDANAAKLLIALDTEYMGSRELIYAHTVYRYRVAEAGDDILLVQRVTLLCNALDRIDALQVRMGDLLGHVIHAAKNQNNHNSTRFLLSEVFDAAAEAEKAFTDWVEVYNDLPV